MGYRSQVARFSIIWIWVTQLTSFKWLIFFLTPNPFSHPQEGLIFKHMLHLKKSLFALPHLQRTRYKKKRGGNEKKGWDVLWGLKNKKCFDASLDPGLAGSRPAWSWQTAEMAVSGMFQRSWCMALHTDPRQVSPTLTGGKKKNKSIKTHKQTTHQGRVDLQSLLQVHSFQSSSPGGVH